MSKRVLRPLLEAVYKLGVFVVLLSVFLAPLGPWWEMLPKSAQEVGRRLGETPEASAGTIVGTRVNTVEFFGGQDSGNQAGRNEGAQNNFQEEAFKLAETGADIIDAYIEVSVQMMAYAATVASTAGEVLLYFDACSPACTPSPAIVLDTTSVGTSDESMYGVFRASVSSEAQMAAYTGAGASLSFQIGYCIDDTNDSACSDGSPAPAHQAAKAKLVITYTYDATSPMLTNTAIYPVASDSDSPTNIGSRPSTLAACTMDTNCPKFYYNAEIPEIAMKAASRSQFFYMQTSLNAATTTDSQFTAQVDGATTGPVHWYEEARSGNGNWISYFIASNSSTLGVNGYQNNVAQKLEIRNTGATTMGVIGGEDYVTYTYPANAAVKTKTVVYPVGEVCTTGCTVLGALTGPTVYFPEEGVVVKKAWFRVHTSTASTTTANLDVVTKVGANAQTASVAYALISDAIGTNQGGYLIHVIPSADYTEMALATGSVGKAVQMRADWSATTRGAISAELVITYQYTSDAGGYMQTETLVAGQQRGTASTSFTSGIVDPAFPEASGAKIIRGVSVRTTLLDTNATADGTVGSNLEIVGTTCSANSSATSTPDMAADLGNLIHFKDLTSKMKTSDATTYKVCYKGSQASIFGGTITITYQVNLPKYIQSAYRIFTNDNAVTVTTALANQDTSATLTSDGQIFRLRLLLDVASGSLAINGDTFKLQAAKRSGTCDTAFSGETYTDISTNTSISYDTTNSPANAADLTTNPSLDPEHGSVATKSQDYMEANNFTNSVSAISSVSQAGLWDFALKDNDVDGSDTFCLRAVRSDGTPFTTGGGTYLVITQITGYGLAPFSQNDYEWFFNADNVQPGSAIQGAENTAATIGSAGVLARLRMNLTVETSDLTVGGGGDWCSVTNYCNSSWLNRRKITFNNTASSENLTNFPVLITLKTASSSVDYSKILANGADIRFIDSDGASLSYEIEKWDEANTTYIWVKVPQIDLGSTTDYIYMYYNNTGASDFQRPSNVWSNSYVIVNHMAQNPGGGAPQMTESSNGRNGTSSGTMTSGDLVAAKVGDGIDFDGTDDRIDMSNASYIDSLGTMSMCAWVNVALPTDRTGYFNVIDKSTNTTDGSSLYLGDNVGNGSGYVINRSTSQTYVEKINSVLPNVWTYFCGAWGGGSTINTYVNGAVQTSYDFTQAGSGTHQNGSTTLYFGSDGGKSNNVIGIIDEVQISSVARSAEWIEASYNWTFKPWNYNTFASEDTYAPSGGNQQFTLQYSTSTGGPWTDVGTGAWAFYNNTGVTDGATLGSALVSTTEVLQTYQESNPSPVNVNSATVGQDIEYDWSLDPANALSTTYYFRMVDASGTALTSYDVNYPAITIGTQNPGTNPNNGGGGGGSGGGAGGGTPISGGGDGGGDGGGGDGGGSGQGGGGGGGGGGGSPMLYDIWFIFDSFLNAPLRDSINSTWQ